MYGDTTVIRALARSLREQGDRVRDEAHVLLHHAEAVPWTGIAADVMRGRARDGACDLDRTAGLHDAAADALDRHADEVDRLKALIARIEHTVLGLVAAARHRLSSLVGSVLPDPLDLLLDRFDPPPPGHRDWLTVDLPISLPGLS
jgi:hypothetical protein